MPCARMLYVSNDGYMGDGWGDTLEMFGNTYWIPSTGFAVYDGGDYQKKNYSL